MKLHTPLYGEHLRHGARFTDYFGWQVPAVYSSEREELERLRHGVGLTEYGFMSHTLVRGPDALSVLEHAVSVSVSAHPPGRTFQALALDHDGKVVEDVVVFRLKEDVFIVSGRGRFDFHDPDDDCLLAAREGKAWLRAGAAGRRVCVQDAGLQLVSVQGPASPEVLVQGGDVGGLDPMTCVQTHLGGIPAVVSRSGYSGEEGFEILVWPEYAVELWRRIEEWGRPCGIAPYGVDILPVISLEKGFLTGRDYYPGSTPLELGLAALVDTGKDFHGRAALMKRLAAGQETRLVRLDLADSAATALPGSPILAGTEAVGRITVAARPPVPGGSLARGWVSIAHAGPGTELVVRTSEGTARAVVSDHCRRPEPAGEASRA